MPLFPVRRDAPSAAFLDGTGRNEFLLVRDRTTGEVLDPKFDAGQDPDRYERFVATGHGAIVSWAVVHGRNRDGESHRTVVGIVELDEGPWWWTELQGADPDANLIGQPVLASFEATGPDENDEKIPIFHVQ